MLQQRNVPKLVLLMWIHRFPFCEVDQVGYDPTIRKYLSRRMDTWNLNFVAITDHYSECNPNKYFFIMKVSGHMWECYEHVLRQELAKE
jgi:hypothetical protein